MTVLFMLLKILLWILLAAVLLALLLLLSLLFVPVVYRAEGSVHENKSNAHVGASWLLGLFQFHLIYEKNELDMYLRLFGIRKGLFEPEDEADTADFKNPKAREQHLSKKKSTDEIVTDETASEDTASDNASEDAAPSAVEHSSSDTASTNRSAQEKPPADDAPDTPDKDSVFQKAVQKKQSLTEKKKRILKRVRWMKRMLQDSSNQDAFCHIKEAVWSLLKCIMPSRLRLQLSYSTGSPDTTAQVFGILALFPAGYTNRWHIYPDFEESTAYAEGDTDIRGHVCLIQILVILLGILFDRKCRRLFKRMKNR